VINTLDDLETKGRDSYRLTDEGLKACTLPCSDPDLARVAAAKPPSQAQAATATPPAPAIPARQPQVVSNGGGNLRATKGDRKPRGGSSAAAVAAPAPLHGAGASVKKALAGSSIPALSDGSRGVKGGGRGP
jgi:hypothetical protein